uniref:Junctional adhesion molecule 2 n=1 Tax=Amazona collaria TaxID=241587 RepID=A0A8B9F312_9PSIT
SLGVARSILYLFVLQKFLGDAKFYCINRFGASQRFLYALFYFFFAPLEAILSCKHKFSKSVSLRIEWKKIQSQGVSFVYYNSEFTGDLQGRAEMLNTGIRIRNVTRRDSGTYRCEISAKSEEGQRLGEATITLTVLGETAAVSVQCQPASKQSGVFIYRRDVVGLGGWLFFMGFLFIFFPHWGMQEREHILLILFLVFSPIDEWQRLVDFFFSLYEEKRKYLLL